MKGTTEKIIGLFDELIQQGEEIKLMCKKLYFSGNKKTIAPETFEAWKINALSLLKSTFGASSPHYDSFVSLKFFDYYNSTQIYLGILRGAREDLGKGYFFHKDLMLSVNIYYSLIARAQHSLEVGETRKAAAVLGTALAEILAKICENKKIPYQQQDQTRELLERLAAAGVFSDSVHSEVLEKEKLLNNSIEDGSEPSDIVPISQWLQGFLNDYLGSVIMILN